MEISSINKELQELAANKTYLASVEDSLKRSQAMAEFLEQNSRDIDSAFYDDFLSERLKAPEGLKTRAQIAETVGELRKGPVLSANIGMGLIKEGIDNKAWLAAGKAERLNMMRKAFDIMTNEMHLPDEVRSGLRLDFEALGTNNNGNCPLFVKAEDGGSLGFDESAETRIVISESIVETGDIKSSLTCILHETVIVMAQSCVIEPLPAFPDPSLADSWTDEVKALIAEKEGAVTDGFRVDGSVQKYCRRMEELFGTIYRRIDAANS